MQKVLLVDDNPNELFSFQRALSSANNQWSILIAESAKTALEIISHETIDVIASDLKLPEMDGVELLRTVSRLSPSTLRIVITGETDPILSQQATLVAHQFIAKPCNPEDLSKVINQIMGVGTLVMKPEIRKEISRIANLPSQPSLYNQLLIVLNQPDIGLDYISTVISQDISMTAKILQLVNSAYFGLAREVTDVSQAVFYLGMETIRDLAFSVHLFSQFDQDFIERSGLGSLWDHSLQIASCSRAVASSMVQDKKGIASSFTAGLLHDIGKLILGTISPGFYRYMVESRLGDSDQILYYERKEFGSTHAEIGAYLLGIWGLPSVIVSAVQNHHNFNGLNSKEFSPAMAVWFTNAFVNSYVDHTNPYGFALSPDKQQIDVLMDHIETWKNTCLQILTR